jgi:hypothetical protein
MEILTRQQAIEKQQVSYFTGVPCKRGHISERWTRNGGCKKCMYPDFIAVGGISNKDIHFGMAIRKFRFQATDIQNFKTVLWGISILRRKELQAADFETKRLIKVAPGKEGTYSYPLWIFLEDEPYLRGIEKEWNSATSEKEQTWGEPLGFRQMQPGEILWPELATPPVAASVPAPPVGSWDGAQARRRALEAAEREANALEEPPEWKL